MPYTIKITKTQTVTRKSGKDWTVVAEEAIVGQERLKSVYGYTPEIEKETTEEVDVLQQTVEEMDLAAVVRAVNGL